MLTRSRKRRPAGICGLVTLPAAVLRSIGSFLMSYECFVVVRTCKNNEGLKSLLTSIEKIRVYNNNLLPHFISVIEPSLISSIGLSVKLLEVILYRENAGALAQLLARLGSLQQFQIFLDLEMRALKQVFPSIPQRVRCLTLTYVDAEALRYLGEAAAAGCLPILEELAFPYMEVDTVQDITGLQTALMVPSLGKNLKFLFLDFPSSEDGDAYEEAGDAWPLLELVLSAEEQTSGNLSGLETLVLRSFTGWGKLAEYLLSRERLPGLKEVYSPKNPEGNHIEIQPQLASGGVAWYEVDSQTCLSWFELLHRRPLQTFNRRISFDGYDVWNSSEEQTAEALELFWGLANRALEPKCTLTIKEIDLMRGAHSYICSDMFEALAGAIRSGNLHSVESLAIGVITTCTSESLGNFGKVLAPAFLPCLTFFAFLIEYPYEQVLGNLELEEPSLLLHSFFGSIPTGGLDNLQKFELQMPSIGRGILLGGLADAQPNCFRFLPELWLTRVFGKNIKEMALILEAGVFPSVERLEISGVCLHICTGLEKDLDDMPRFLRALSDYTNVKELHVIELTGCQPTRGFVRPLLELMLSSLSESTSPAFFPSLQVLKITIDYYHLKDGPDYISDYVRPLLLSIKALRPPNLTTIILGGKRI